MNQSLAGKTVALLVANGVDETQLTEMQRALTKAGAKMHTIAPEQGVISSWHGNDWGHHLAADHAIGEVLGSDYDALVLPGGERSMEKLKQNLHTRRIVNHFLDAGKPISAVGAGAALLALGTRIAGRTIAAPADMRGDLKTAQVECAEDNMIIDDNILSAMGPDAAAWVEETLRLFTGESDDVQQAA